MWIIPIKKYFLQVLKIKQEFINPSWDDIQIPIGVLCNGDYSCELKFTLWNYVNSSKKNFMGEFKIEVSQLIERMKSLPLEFDIINENNIKKKVRYYFLVKYFVMVMDS